MARTKPITGRHVLLMLVAFFGIMLIANAVFVVVAVRSFPGEAEKKSYLQGLQFNETLAARAEQKKLGWRAEIVELGRESVEVRLFDEAGAALSGLAVAGDLRRPAFNGADRSLIFDETAAGVYRAEVAPLDLGAWDFSGVAEDGLGRRFEFQARVSVR